MEVIGCSTAAEVERLTEDRGRWHTIVANVNIDTALRQGKVRYPSKMVRFCHFWFYSAIWSLGRGAPLGKNLGLGRIKYMHKYADIVNRFSFWKTELYNKQGLKAFTKKIKTQDVYYNLGRIVYYAYIYMHISSLTCLNSLPLKSWKKTKKNGKLPWIKSILFSILHMMCNFYSIWTTNKNTVVSHRKENFIVNGKRRIFLYISYLNLVHLITMHYYMDFGKDHMNTFLYNNFLTLL